MKFDILIIYFRKIDPSNPYKNLFLSLVFLCSVILIFFYYSLPISIVDHYPRFLIHNSKCSIPNFLPLNRHSKKHFKRLRYHKCGNETLTFIRKFNNIPFLYINQSVMHKYTPHNVSCCYLMFERSSEASEPDNANLSRSVCHQFKDETAVQGNAVYVECRCTVSGKKVYENVHTWIIVKKEVEENWKNIPSNSKPYSVLIVAIDSVSRLNLIRGLPKTYKFLTKNNWFSMDVFNKVGENTFPNAMAMLGGFNRSDARSICKPEKRFGLDDCPLLIYKFRDLGYATAYAEDEPTVSTFNFKPAIGFIKPPTHYYFRPYFQLTNELKIFRLPFDGARYCTGPEVTGERVMNIAKEFAITMKERPSFGLFWMNSFSHNFISTPTRMDEKIEEFLSSLKENNVLENSIVIFLSDHGMRFGKYAETKPGWYESRLPFIFFSMPERFKKEYPSEIDNLDAARFKLTNPFDVYMTLQHILVLSGLNHTITPSTGCPKCRSLFTYIPNNRSCEEISIDKYFCTCLQYDSVKVTDSIVKGAANFALRKINDFTKVAADKCRTYVLDSIKSAKVSTADYGTYYMVIIKTKPVARFEAPVMYNPKSRNKKNIFEIEEGQITRVDSYGPHSGCVVNRFLRQYCYCK